jgi:transcriptional regulator with XRE-family HTH domain
MNEHRLNRWQLAQEAKLGTASITRLEAQDRDQSLSVFNQIATLFGIPLWKLFKPVEDSDRRSSGANELAQVYDACPSESDRAKALAIARLVLTAESSNGAGPTAPHG